MKKMHLFDKKMRGNTEKYIEKFCEGFFPLHILNTSMHCIM